MSDLQTAANPVAWRRRQRAVERADPDQGFVNLVMKFWDQRMDTFAIAVRLSETEAVVTKALRIGREQRREA